MWSLVNCQTWKVLMLLLLFFSNESEFVVMIFFWYAKPFGTLWLKHIQCPARWEVLWTLHRPYWGTCVPADFSLNWNDLRWFCDRQGFRNSSNWWSVYCSSDSRSRGALPKPMRFPADFLSQSGLYSPNLVALLLIWHCHQCCGYHFRWDVWKPLKCQLLQLAEVVWDQGMILAKMWLN